MVKRVIIDSSAASPLRVSVAGVDADSAEFNDLIFDGNQSPLRLSSVGWVHCEGMSWNEFLGGQNTRESSPVVVTSSPTGTTPIFVCSVVKFGGVGFMWTPFRLNAGNDGAGGSICQSGGTNYFISLAFDISPPTAPDPNARSGGYYCNYAVMKNWT